MTQAILGDFCFLIIRFQQATGCAANCTGGSSAAYVTTDNAIGGADSGAKSRGFRGDFPTGDLLGNFFTLGKVFFLLRRINVVGIDDRLGCTRTQQTGQKNAYQETSCH